MVERAFVTVAGREVHYRRVGEGPPALFIHSSPTNSGFVADDMLALAGRFTCFAFDTPGFGLSDPLPGDTLTVADLAAATVAAIDALGLGPLPIYGTHTGAAIALELGCRHPEKTTGLVLDAVPIFTREEVEPFGDDYFAPLVVDVLGGHFSATWTRFRDQSMWFPWCFREPENLNPYDLLSPAEIHRWAEMFFAAAPHYKAAYPAAVRYCEGAIEAASALTCPAIFTASSTDMLHSHLDRLPPLKRNQWVAEFGTDVSRKREIIGNAFTRSGTTAIAPELSRPLAGGACVRRQFLPDCDRQQMVRYAGEHEDRVTLLLHDVPGSSKMVEDRIAALAGRGFVVAPDLPGSGESEPLGIGDELAGYAAAMWQLCDAAGVETVSIEAYGLSASLALEMARSAPERVTGVAINGLLLPDDTERSKLIDHYAPPIEVDPDGAHWYRTWLMVRDGLTYWPWYDRRMAALHRVPSTFEAQTLHDRTVETMKQRESYGRYIRAVLRHDAAAALGSCRIAVTKLDDPQSILGKVYGERLSALIEERTWEG